MNTVDFDYNIDQLSFDLIIREWLRYTRSHIKESSYAKYSNLINNYILPHLGGRLICDLSYDTFEHFCSQLLTSGGAQKNGLSPKTVSDIIVLLRSILQYAENKGAALACNAKSITIRQHTKKLRILSSDEQKRLCKYLYTHISERNLGILICLFTGLRLGEICALKWDDISLSNKTIFVYKTMQRVQIKKNSEQKTKLIISSPKSQCSIRTIPFPEAMLPLMTRMQRNSSAYVLTGNAGKYVEPRTMQNHFHKVMAACSIEQSNYHMLRHTFATRCAELGFDAKLLSEILGHSTVNLTMNRYVHPSIEIKQYNMNKLSSLITLDS